MRRAWLCLRRHQIVLGYRGAVVEHLWFHVLNGLMLQLSDRLIRNIVTISGVRIVVAEALEVLVKLD